MIELQSMIEGCQKGNERWQQTLYETFSPRYFALCLRYAPSREEAEDMLVEGFVKIFQSIDSYRGDGSFEGWMHRIFTNVAHNHYRHIAAEHWLVRDDGMTDKVVHSSIAATIDVPEATRQAMQALSPNERIIFNMVAIEGYTLSDVAQEVQAPLGTVKYQYYHAKETMQNELRRRLGDDYIKNRS